MPAPFAHLFFETGDRSFFGLGDSEASVPDPTAPSWLDRIAAEAHERNDFKRKQESSGINVLGQAGHEPVDSIHFFDPGGIRLELTSRIPPDAILEEFGAHCAVRKWVERDKWQAWS